MEAKKRKCGRIRTCTARQLMVLCRDPSRFPETVAGPVWGL